MQAEEECVILQNLHCLAPLGREKLNIKSTLKVRDKINNRYRIRISKLVCGGAKQLFLLAPPSLHGGAK